MSWPLESGFAAERVYSRVAEALGSVAFKLMPSSLRLAPQRQSIMPSPQNHQGYLRRFTIRSHTAPASAEWEFCGRLALEMTTA